MALFALPVHNADAIGVYTDPGRVAAIELCSSQAKKALDAQMRAQMLMTAGHIWIAEEVNAITDFQREFNDYLDSFHDILSWTAEIYGIYCETNRIMKNVKSLDATLSASPANALAVAFSTRRNKVYRDIIAVSLDVLMDLKKICIEQSKMTEHERDKILHGIRPKMQRFNKKLRALDIAIKYTTMADVWREIASKANSYGKRSKRTIVDECLSDWKANVKKKH